MPNESNSGKSYRRLSRVSHSPELEAELYTLVDALLDSQISEQQAQRLEQLVVTDRAVMQLYLELMYEFNAAHRNLVPVPLDLGLSDESGASPNEMEESMVLPAITESDLAVDEQDTVQLPPSPTPLASPTHNRRWWRGGAAAAILVIGFTTWLILRHPPKLSPETAKSVPPPAVVEYPVTITATAVLPPDQDLTDKPGTTFNAGEVVELSKGGMELTFASGAVVVVQGPARFHAIDRNSMALENGTMTAHVPGSAIGFRVAAPGLDAVDRGTNFGIRTLSATPTISEIHVFDGLVDVTGTDKTGQLNSAAIHVTAGQALQHDATDASPPVSIPFAPAQFTRDLSQARFAVALHNTGDIGDSAKQGKPTLLDPYWQVISVPTKPGWVPKAAELIANVPGLYAVNTSPGRWIGVHSKLDDEPVGDFDFQTKVDLTGLDPQSVKATVLMAADDYVADIKVNGSSTGVSSPVGLVATVRSLPNGIWHSGMNDVDVIVHNMPLTLSTPPNWLTLKVSWNATALPLVRR